MSNKLIASFVATPLLVLLTAVGCIGAAKRAQFAAYDPRAGDVVLQSLPSMDLVRAIEGVTESPFSHCGIVVQRDDRWYVLEAIGPVRYTPLHHYLDRGRGDAYAVYRLRDSYHAHVPAIIAAGETMLGRPYDSRYRLDEEAIYCSELIYKAFKTATGEELGQLEALGTLNWQPHERTIRKYEGGGLPLERPMITPVGLTRAEQLELVLQVGY